LVSKLNDKKEEESVWKVINLNKLRIFQVGEEINQIKKSCCDVEVRIKQYKREEIF
jgi:hypothetical protein